MADQLLHKNGALRLGGRLRTSALAAVAYTRSAFSSRLAEKVKQRWTGFAGSEARGVGAVHRSIALSAGLAVVLVGVRGSGRRAGGAVVRESSWRLPWRRAMVIGQSMRRRRDPARIECDGPAVRPRRPFCRTAFSFLLCVLMTHSSLVSHDLDRLRRPLLHRRHGERVFSDAGRGPGREGIRCSVLKPRIRKYWESGMAHTHTGCARAQDLSSLESWRDVQPVRLYAAGSSGHAPVRLSHMRSAFTAATRRARPRARPPARRSERASARA